MVELTFENIKAYLKGEPLITPVPECPDNVILAQRRILDFLDQNSTTPYIGETHIPAAETESRALVIKPHEM